jgi:hypothetical protein
VYVGFHHRSADMLVWFYPNQNSCILLPISQICASSLLLLNVGKAKNMVMLEGGGGGGLKAHAAHAKFH